MKLGSAPISWGVSELPDWGIVLPRERVLDEIAACGYAGTELGPSGYLPRDATALGRALSSRGLELAGAFCPVTLHDPARHKQQLDHAFDTARVLASVGAPVLVLAEAGDEPRRRIAGRVGPRDLRFSEEDWKRFASGANEVALHAAELGLACAFHPHAGTYVETPTEIDELLRRTDPTLIGLCLDTGHVAYGGGDPIALARRERGRVRHVHLKDLDRGRLDRARSDGMDFAEAVGRDVFVPLGEGSLDMKGMLAALRESVYSGWLIVEQDIRIAPGRPREPKLDARKSYAFLRAELSRPAGK